MPQVKVREKYQVTIPSKIREHLGLRIGDLLEAELEDDHIVLRPQIVIDKAEAWNRFRAALKEVHAKNQDIDEDQVIKDVLDELHALNQEKHAQSRG